MAKRVSNMQRFIAAAMVADTRAEIDQIIDALVVVRDMRFTKAQPVKRVRKQKSTDATDTQTEGV